MATKIKTKAKSTGTTSSKEETRQEIMRLWESLESMFYALQDEITEGRFRAALHPDEREELCKGCEHCVDSLASYKLYPPAKPGLHILHGVLDAIAKEPIGDADRATQEAQGAA
jgi:hypothetical protein